MGAIFEQLCSDFHRQPLSAPNFNDIHTSRACSYVWIVMYRYMHVGDAEKLRTTVEKLEQFVISNRFHKVIQSLL